MGFLDFFAGSAVLGAMLGTVAGYAIGIMFIFSSAAAGKRVPLLTNLWMIIGGSYASVFASAEASIAAGAEPSGILMGTGLVLFPLLVAGAPVILVMSAITLIKEAVDSKLKLVAWFARLFLSCAALHTYPSVTATYAACVLAFASVVAPTIWLVQAIRS